MNTGTSRTERVSNALQSVFSDPTEFLKGVESLSKESHTEPVNNVVQGQFGKNATNEDWDL